MLKLNLSTVLGTLIVLTFFGHSTDKIDAVKKTETNAEKTNRDSTVDSKSSPGKLDTLKSPAKVDTLKFTQKTKVISRIQFIDFLSANSSDSLTNSIINEYQYNDGGKLVEIQFSEYNPVTKSYDEAYTGYKFDYTADGALRQWHMLGGGGIETIQEFDYSDPRWLLVKRYQAASGIKRLDDWWTIEKTDVALTIKYYQLANELYAQLDGEIDGSGNLISIRRTPSFPVGTMYYGYDRLPNPFYFPELAGEFLNTNAFFSKNNATKITSDAQAKSDLSIVYNADNYPLVIRTGAYEKIITYR